MVFMFEHPRGQGVARRQGGQQSGAAGDAPLAKKGFADRQKNNVGGKLPTNNRPAKVAMDWLMSQATRPDATAARHTDARSLAVPVPRGTMIPTDVPTGIVPFGRPPSCGSRDYEKIASSLRRVLDKVYALASRVRILFQKN
jgi:hypothetical protein